MGQAFRLPQGGIVDRTRPQRFCFNGVWYEGFAGDTLAAALLANGVHLVARSFKYHRPRGVLSAGAEEPNALVQLGVGARTEPNARATQIELHEGLVAASQNCWPSVRFDVGAINNALSAFIPAGFYYKTFMWPRGPKWWLRYEHLIRHAAGMGRGACAPDPDHYAHHYAHSDVLVIGAGPAGLAAARAAARCGARVVVCDEGSLVGGALLGTDALVDRLPAAQWLAQVQRELAANPDVTLLTRTTAFGYYDGNLVGLVERVRDHLAAPSPDLPRERMWKLRAKAVVLASGAHERPMVYAENDLPGTMLAGSARTYVQRYGVRPGSRAVVFTNNDSAYAAALALHQAGVAIAAIVDARPDAGLEGGLVAQARAAGLPITSASVIVSAHGRLHVSAVTIAALEGGVGRERRIACDLVMLSGGWNPAVHLFSQARGTLRFDAALATFVPEVSPLPIFPAGAANACFDLAAALADGHGAGLAAAASAGFAARAALAAPYAEPLGSGPLKPLWAVPARDRFAKCFVDFQNDVTANDIKLAVLEGYHSVEHLKRYTTLGMGTDQGRTSNVNGIGILADLEGRAPGDVGTTTFRPPVTAVRMATIAGNRQGALYRPMRRLPAHAAHERLNAVFEDFGWL
ncbi:MAG: 2Fe-2S iron-sulfur cluster-binding protein, partial [Burkholderiaceae bacterium]